MITAKRLDEFIANIARHSPKPAAAAEELELIALARLGLQISSEEGPPGVDRRWKMACEQSLGRTFNTPREMMNYLAALPKGTP